MRRTGVHNLVAALGVAVAFLAVAVPAAGARPSFYEPPRNIDRFEPGEVIRAERFEALAAPGAPLPGRAWRILYRSETARGRPVAVSGTVIVPNEPAPGPLRLVGLAIGTHGLADRCAPSRQLAAGSDYEAFAFEALLERGWAVAATDYEGQGTPGIHTYVVGRATGRNVLDSMRAARDLTPAGIPNRGPTAAMGYSEGGGAAGWVAQIADGYAPELRLRGVAVGGVVAKLLATARFNDGGLASFLIPYASIGFDRAYPELDLGSYLNPRGREVVRELRRTCIDEALAVEPGTPYRDLTRRDPLADRRWIRRLAENSLGRTAPGMPVLLQHARLDNVLPFASAERLRAQWCARGTRLQFGEIVAADHISGAFAALPTALAWLDGRFAGERAPQNCD